MASVIAVSASTAALAEKTPADRPTYYKDVVPILQESCQVCHRDGGANFGGMYAPMAFTSYSNVRPWAKAIAKNVSNGTMPPWHADQAHAGEFENERTITEEQIATLVTWTETGAARGNPADAPPAKEFPIHEGWQIGEPDLIVKMTEPFLVEDEVEDLYQRFTTHISKEMLPEPRWIRASETRPGSGAVHHIVAHPAGGLVPGGDPKVYPEGVGMLLMPDTTIYWDVHYHKEAGPGTAVWDQSEIGIKFYPKDVKVTHMLRSAMIADWDFVIPAGHPNYEVLADYTFNEDVRIINYMPHMHLRGSAAKFEAFYPDGNSEVLLNIPNYDFNWQTTYQYRDFKFIPKGTRIELTSVFDNSADNPANPDPTIDVTFGTPTTAEMIKSPIEYIRAVDREDVEALIAARHHGKKGSAEKGKTGSAPAKISNDELIQAMKNKGMTDEEISEYLESLGVGKKVKDK
jgi:mono/diheme cytochrome c family protein